MQAVWVAHAITNYGPSKLVGAAASQADNTRIPAAVPSGWLALTRTEMRRLVDEPQDRIVRDLAMQRLMVALRIYHPLCTISKRTKYE